MTKQQKTALNMAKFIQSRGQCTEKMLRIIVEFLTKVSLHIKIKLVKLLQQ